VPQFLASAFSSFASEWAGAIVAARALHIIEFDIALEEDSGRLSKGKSSPSKSQPRVQPFDQDPGSCAGSRDLAHDGSPGGRREQAANKLLLAVKIAHEELGEKTAIFLGCSVAARVGGLNSMWAGKALALLLLEAISDLAKASAYAAFKIDVGRARFNFHWPSLLGVALLGGASCAGLLPAIGVNCLLGEDIASAFG
jgi:hypothetical protein